MSSLFQGGPNTNQNYNSDQGAQGGIGSSQAVYQDINPNDINQALPVGANAGQAAQQQEAYANWYNENQSNRGAFQNELSQSQNRAAPTMSASLAGPTTINTGNYTQDRGQQIGLVNQLQQQAAGQGPNLAAAQLKQGQEQAISQQMAMLGSQRGSSNAATAQRQAQLGAASTMAATNQAAGQATIQQQVNAQNQLGGVLSGMQGSDLGLASNQANLSQAANLANAGFQNTASQNNLQAYLQNQQMNQQLEGSANASLAGLNSQDMASMQAGQQNQLQQYLAMMGANTAAGQIAGTEQSQALAAAVSALGSGAAASDERGKVLSLSPGDQKVLTPSTGLDAFSILGTGAGSSGLTGQDAGAAAAQAADLPTDAHGNPELAAAMQAAAKSAMAEKPMFSPEGNLGQLPATTATPQPLPWMQQASALNQISNGTIALSPGGEKVLSMGPPTATAVFQGNPYGNTPISLPGQLPHSSEGFVNGVMQRSPSMFAKLMAPPPITTMNPPGPPGQAFPTWQPLPTANASQQGREAQAMSGGNAGAMQAFLSGQAGQGGSNAAMLNQAQGATSYGNAAPPPPAPTTSPAPPTTSPAPPTPTQSSSAAAPSLGSPATSSSKATAPMQAIPVQQSGINAPQPGPSQMGMGTGNITTASPSFIPAINSPVVQSAPTNSPQTIQTAGALSPEGEKVLDGEAHTADKASPEETEANSNVADDKLRAFLRDVDAHQYTYVRPNLEGAGAGTYISPMAQELKKSEVGKSMVTPGADGLDRVDYGKGFGAMLAAQARHERRLDDVESRLASALKAQRGA